MNRSQRFRNFMHLLHHCFLIFVNLLTWILHSCDASSFDPLGIIPDAFTLSSALDGVVNLFSQTFESTFGTKKEKPTSSRGVAG